MESSCDGLTLDCGEKYLILTTGLILAVLGSKTVLTVLTV